MSCAETSWTRLTLVMLRDQVNPDRAWCFHPRQLWQRGGNQATFWWKCRLCSHQVRTRHRSQSVDFMVAREREQEEIKKKAKRAEERASTKAAASAAKTQGASEPLRARTLVKMDQEVAAHAAAMRQQHKKAAAKAASSWGQEMKQILLELQQMQEQTNQQVQALTQVVQKITEGKNDKTEEKDADMQDAGLNHPVAERSWSNLDST